MASDTSAKDTSAKDTRPSDTGGMRHRILSALLTGLLLAAAGCAGTGHPTPCPESEGILVLVPDLLTNHHDILNSHLLSEGFTPAGVADLLAPLDGELTVDSKAPGVRLLDLRNPKHRAFAAGLPRDAREFLEGPWNVIAVELEGRRLLVGANHVYVDDRGHWNATIFELCWRRDKFPQ